jgi:hypothetical protein
MYIHLKLVASSWNHIVRVRRKLCDVEKGGVIAEPGAGGLELKETLAHVLVWQGTLAVIQTKKESCTIAGVENPVLIMLTVAPHHISEVPKQISEIQGDIERWPPIRKLSDQTFGLRTPWVIILGEEPPGAMFGRVFSSERLHQSELGFEPEMNTEPEKRSVGGL